MRASDFISNETVNVPGWQLTHEDPAGSTHFPIFFPLEKGQGFPCHCDRDPVPSSGREPGDLETWGREREGEWVERGRVKGTRSEEQPVREGGGESSWSAH